MEVWGLSKIKVFQNTPDHQRIFDLGFKQLTASKKEGTPKGIPFFLVAGTELRLNHILMWIRGFKDIEKGCN